MDRTYKKRRKLTSADEDEIFRLHVEEARSLSEIAKIMGTSITPIQRVARERGIVFPTQQRWSNVLRARAAAAYMAGATSTVLAERFRTTASVILDIVRAEGGKIRRKVREFSAEDESVIERRYLEGEAACEIAPSYGVFHKRILAVLRRRGVRIRRNTWVWWTDRRGRRIHFRSKWELWVAQHLDAAGLTWDFEHQRFPVVVDGEVRHYTPDFWVWDGDVLRALIDVKGKTQAKQARKIVLFQEQYPDLPFELWNGAVLRSFGLAVTPSNASPYNVS